MYFDLLFFLSSVTSRATNKKAFVFFLTHIEPSVKLPKGNYSIFLASICQRVDETDF